MGPDFPHVLQSFCLLTETGHPLVIPYLSVASPLSPHCPSRYYLNKLLVVPIKTHKYLDSFSHCCCTILPTPPPSQDSPSFGHLSHLQDLISHLPSARCKQSIQCKSSTQSQHQPPQWSTLCPLPSSSLISPLCSIQQHVPFLFWNMVFFQCSRIPSSP